MKRCIPALTALLSALPALAQDPLMVEVDGLDAKGQLDKKYAPCIATADGKSTKGENQRPSVRWAGGPADAKSYAIVVEDADVPADLSIANHEDYLIAEDMPRQTFYHWVQYDIGPAQHELPGGDKPTGYGRSAANDVSEGTDVYGYGGPCPPWNDALRHRYVFTVHALNTARLNPPAEGKAAEVVALIEKHSIASGSATATYTLNPQLRKGKL